MFDRGPASPHAPADAWVRSSVAVTPGVKLPLCSWDPPVGGVISAKMADRANSFLRNASRNPRGLRWDCCRRLGYKTALVRLVGRSQLTLRNDRHHRREPLRRTVEPFPVSGNLIESVEPLGAGVDASSGHTVRSGVGYWHSGLWDWCESLTGVDFPAADRYWQWAALNLYSRCR